MRTRSGASCGCDELACVGTYTFCVHGEWVLTGSLNPVGVTEAARHLQAYPDEHRAYTAEQRCSAAPSGWPPIGALRVRGPRVLGVHGTLSLAARVPRERPTALAWFLGFANSYGVEPLGRRPRLCDAPLYHRLWRLRLAAVPAEGMGSLAPRGRVARARRQNRNGTTSCSVPWSVAYSCDDVLFESKLVDQRQVVEKNKNTRQRRRPHSKRARRSGGECAPARRRSRAGPRGPSRSMAAPTPARPSFGRSWSKSGHFRRTLANRRNWPKFDRFRPKLAQL